MAGCHRKQFFYLPSIPPKVQKEGREHRAENLPYQYPVSTIVKSGYSIASLLRLCGNMSGINIVESGRMGGEKEVYSMREIIQGENF